MLTYMAQHMVRSSRTTFSIEDIQPSWMHGKALKSKYLFIFSIIAVSCVILFLTASYTLVNMWVFSFLREELLDPIKILSDGVLVGLFFGLPISLFTIGAAFNDITTVETLNLSWKRVKEVLRQNLTVFGFGIMVAFVLSIGEIVKDISAENTATGVVLVVARTLASILIFSLFLYLVTSSMTISATIRGSAVNDKTVPNQGIWRTVLNASIATFTAGVVLTVLTSITQSLDQLPVYLPLITEVVALVSGGTSCMKHLSLRILLRLTGHAPWNYAQFLDYATERLLLQKVGGSYIFIHRTLLEHFSQLDSRLTSK